VQFLRRRRKKNNGREKIEGRKNTSICYEQKRRLGWPAYGGPRKIVGSPGKKEGAQKIIDREIP